MADGTHHPCLLYLGTESGLYVATTDGTGLNVVASALPGEAVRAVDVHPSAPDRALVGCGLRGHGLFRVRDAGEHVETLGFQEEWVWGIARHPDDPETVYVGTEPPGVYRSRDGGDSFEALDGIDDLPSRSRWTFFHEPFEAGHVHGFAIHPDRPDRIVAGVEHGAIIYSEDGGETWNDSLVGADVHRVTIDPTDPDHVLAATGGGLQRSRDGGRTWEPIADVRGYAHSIVFDPNSPNRAYAYTATEGNPIHASRDGAQTWRSIGSGLPAARPADTLRVHPTASRGLLYVGDTDDGRSRLFVRSALGPGGEWKPITGTVPKVWRLAVTPMAE